MVEKSRKIPVSLGLLPRLEDKVSAARQWMKTAKKTFILQRSPLTLLEVMYAQYT